MKLFRTLSVAALVAACLWAHAAAQIATQSPPTAPAPIKTVFPSPAPTVGGCSTAQDWLGDLARPNSPRVVKTSLGESLTGRSRSSIIHACLSDNDNPGSMEPSMLVNSCIPVIPSADLDKSPRFWVDGLGLSMDRAR
jgi:hypothetical protein